MGETTVASGSGQASAGPEGEGKRKYASFIAFVFLITNAHSGKFGKVHKNVKKKRNSLEHWHPEATMVNTCMILFPSLVYLVFTCWGYKWFVVILAMSYNDTEACCKQYFPQIFLGAPNGASQMMSQILLSIAGTGGSSWRPATGASAGDGPCGVPASVLPPLMPTGFWRDAAFCAEVDRVSFCPALYRDMSPGSQSNNARSSQPPQEACLSLLAIVISCKQLSTLQLKTVTSTGTSPGSFLPHFLSSNLRGKRNEKAVPVSQGMAIYIAEPEQ